MGVLTGGEKVGIAVSSGLLLGTRLGRSLGMKEYSFIVENQNGLLEIDINNKDNNNETEHVYLNGDIVRISNLVGISTVLFTNTDYYVKRVSKNGLKIARSLRDVIQDNFLIPEGDLKVTLESKSLSGSNFSSSKSLKKILKNK